MTRKRIAAILLAMTMVPTLLTPMATPAAAAAAPTVWSKSDNMAN